MGGKIHVLDPSAFPFFSRASIRGKETKLGKALELCRSLVESIALSLSLSRGTKYVCLNTGDLKGRWRRKETGSWNNGGTNG